MKHGHPAGVRLRLFLAALFGSAVLLMLAVSTATALPAVGVISSQHYYGNEPDWEAVERSGASTYRMEFSMGAFSGGASWANTYDLHVEKAAKHGITILAYLNGGEQGRQFPLSNQWGGWLNNMVWQAVTRYGENGTFWAAHPGLPYKPITLWEVWNEPNLPINNPGGSVVQPRAYGELLEAASTYIQGAADARQTPNNAKVLFGGLWQNGGASGVAEYIQKATGQSSLANYYDGLSLHPYSLSGSEATKLQGMKNAVNAARTALTTYGGAGKSLWITELGWPVAGTGHPTVSEAEQATLLTNSFNWLKAESGPLGLGLITWYLYRDAPGGTNWDAFCGLRKADGGYRPSWWAFQAQAGVPPWPLPAVETLKAIGIQEKQATLNGMINPNGTQVSYRFDYGTTTSYGSSVPVPSGSTGPGSTGVWMSAVATGLQPSTEYHYRIVATNPAGTTYGADKEFETPRPAVPVPSPSAGGWNGVIWRGTDGNIFETNAPSGEWQSYSPTWSKQGIPSGVTPVGNPVVAPSGTGWDGIIWHGSDGNIYETHAPGGVWQSYSPTWSRKGIPPGVTPVGNPTPSPSAGGWNGIIWRGSDGNIYETHANSGSWESYSLTWSKQGIPPGVKVASDPVPSPSGSGWDGVIWRGSDGNIYETHAPGGVWQSYSPTWSKKGVPNGVKAVGNPVPSPSAGGWNGIIWRGSDGNVYETNAPNGEWQSYSPTWSRKGIPSGVTVAGDPVPSPSGSGWDGILWRGSDGNIYETHAPGGVWQSYSPTWSKKGVPSGVSMSVNIGP